MSVKFKIAIILVIPVIIFPSYSISKAVEKSYYFEITKKIPKLRKKEIYEMEKYFPLKKYKEFPLNLRPIFQREDYERDNCRGDLGPNGQRYSSAMRSCKIAERVSDALQAYGWCWGGGRIAADDRWSRCKIQR